MITRPTPRRATREAHAHAPLPRHAALRPAWRLSGGSARRNAPPVADAGPIRVPSGLLAVPLRNGDGAVLWR